MYVRLHVRPYASFLFRQLRPTVLVRFRFRAARLPFLPTVRAIRHVWINCRGRVVMYKGVNLVSTNSGGATNTRVVLCVVNVSFVARFRVGLINGGTKRRCLVNENDVQRGEGFPFLRVVLWGPPIMFVEGAFRCRSLGTIIYRGRSQLNKVTLRILRSFRYFRRVRRAIINGSKGHLVELLKIRIHCCSVKPRTCRLITCLVFRASRRHCQRGRSNRPSYCTRRDGTSNELKRLFSALVTTVSTSNGGRLPIRVDLLPFQSVLPVPCTMQAARKPSPLSSAHERCTPRCNLRQR